MPKLPIDYSRSLIYKLCCNDINIKEEYIGSSTDLTRRKSTHKECCNNPNSQSYNLKVYRCIRENNGWDNWSMILVESFPCENKLELRKRERYWIETLKPTLNSCIPTRTMIEWRDEYNKQYYINNADIEKERQKKYYTNNIEKIKKNNKEKITCECSAIVCKIHITRHRKTDKHKKLLQQITP